MTLNSTTVNAGEDALATERNDLRKDVIEKAGDRVVATGSANAYDITTDAQITEYTAGQRFIFVANFTNTGAPTGNVNSLGDLSIQDVKGNVLGAGAITSGSEIQVMYDGVVLIVLSGVSATTANEGSVEMLTDSEAATGIDEKKYINSKQAKDIYGTPKGISISNISTTGAVTYAHGLNRTPTFVQAKTMAESAYNSVSQVECFGTYDGANIGLYRHRTSGVPTVGTNIIEGQNLKGTITSIDGINITITWTGSAESVILNTILSIF